MRTDGRYTLPRTWGVYEITSPRGVSEQRIRFGNHPIRQRELTAEFGSVKLVALYPSRDLAGHLKRVLEQER